MAQTEPLILTFVGMPGAGKSSCISRILEGRPDLPVLYFGGITIDEVKRRGMEVTEANERIVREDIRAQEGKDAYARRICDKIDALTTGGNECIIVDGLYSWSEYKVFKNRYGERATIIAVTAPRTVRHRRLANRPVRPLTEQEAIAREYAEIENLEKGGPIANADYTIVNGREGKEHLRAQIDELIAPLLKD